LPQALLGELAALHHTPSWISSGAAYKGGRGEGRKKKGRELRKEDR